MDDGSKAGSGFIFCTDSFTREEVLLLCHVLNDKFGLACAAVPLPLAATKGCHLAKGGRTSLGPNALFISRVWGAYRISVWTFVHTAAQAIFVLVQ
jgi:hypothetical protein